MNLADERLKELDSPSLTENERALLRCRLAAEFVHTGQYESAREALGPFWRGVGERPVLEGLGESTAAEVLLQVGALSGCVGASRQTAGSQGSAKDLISESAAVFERLGEFDRAAAARSDLAVCYWREGAYDEARVILQQVVAGAREDAELTAKAVLRLSMVETSAGRYGDALRLLGDFTPLFEGSANDALKGRFHNELAIVLRKLGTAERRQDYFDQAIIEYTAAVYHFGQTRQERYAAAIGNNFAFLLYKLGRYRQAHEQLDRAGATLFRLRDAGLLAQVDETRARIFLAENKYRDAERVITRAVQALEQGGASALLADALAVQGVVLARMGDAEASLRVLHRALKVAEADELLKDTQDAEEVSRLRACARVVMRRLAASQITDKNFSFYGAIHELEAQLIEQAFDAAGGSITRAAKLLGLKHQTLGSILSQRHKNLAERRAPRGKRLRSIIKEPKE